MYTHSLDTGIFPPTMYEANITLLHKEGKEETELSPYRPISFLNSDMKIFAQVLANRLNKYISSIVHPDQTGLVPKRFSFLTSDS